MRISFSKFGLHKCDQRFNSFPWYVIYLHKEFRGKPKAESERSLMIPQHELANQQVKSPFQNPKGKRRSYCADFKSLPKTIDSYKTPTLTLWQLKAFYICFSKRHQTNKCVKPNCHWRGAPCWENFDKPVGDCSPTAGTCETHHVAGLPTFRLPYNKQILSTADFLSFLSWMAAVVTK